MLSRRSCPLGKGCGWFLQGGASDCVPLKYGPAEAKTQKGSGDERRESEKQGRTRERGRFSGLPANSSLGVRACLSLWAERGSESLVDIFLSGIYCHQSLGTEKNDGQKKMNFGEAVPPRLGARRAGTGQKIDEGEDRTDFGSGLSDARRCPADRGQIQRGDPLGRGTLSFAEKSATIKFQLQVAILALRATGCFQSVRANKNHAGRAWDRRVGLDG